MRLFQKLFLPLVLIAAVYCVYALSQALAVTPVNPRLLQNETRFREKFGKYYGPSVEETLFRINEPLANALED